ncbi:MAG: Trm112 family protein [Rhodobacterales bacterium]|nr:Trm112 family protein [Rhodobacterales bacterium]
MTAAQDGPAFDRRMLEALVCPRTHQRLEYDAAAQELVSPTANLAFPIRAGIPILLLSEGRPLE